MAPVGLQHSLEPLIKSSVDRLSSVSEPGGGGALQSAAAARAAAMRDSAASRGDITKSGCSDAGERGQEVL